MSRRRIVIAVIAATLVGVAWWAAVILGGAAAFRFGAGPETELVGGGAVMCEKPEPGSANSRCVVRPGARPVLGAQEGQAEAAWPAVDTAMSELWRCSRSDEIGYLTCTREERK